MPPNLLTTAAALVATGHPASARAHGLAPTLAPHLAPDLAARLGLEPNVPLCLDAALAAAFVARHGPLVAGDDDGQALRARKKAALLAGFTVQEVRRGYALTADGVALVPVFGSLGPERYWCWTSYEEVVFACSQAVADPTVRAVLLVVDSPGGYVAGCAEAATALTALAGQGKPFASVAADCAASAAYWLACAGSRLSASPTAVVGSVGALVLHVEFSQALAQWGAVATVVRSGPRKAETNPLEPLTEVARAQLQTEVDTAAGLFVAHVATRRSLSPEVVRATEAAAVTGQQGLKLGLVDAVETPAAALATLTAAGRSAATTSRARAGAQNPPPKARSNPQPRSQTRPLTQNHLRSATVLTEAEQAARRDEIAEIVAAAADTDAARAAQYQEVVAVVERPAPEADEDAAPAEDDPAARTRRTPAASLAQQRAEDRAALALPEAAGRTDLVLSLRAKGLSAAEIAEVLGATAQSAFTRARQAAAGQPVGNATPGETTPAPGSAASLVDSVRAVTGRTPRRPNP